MILADMKMPKNCSDCNLHNSVGLCLINNSSTDYKLETRPGTCPLKEQEITWEICANAALKLWMFGMIYDDEYLRLLDSLNSIITIEKSRAKIITNGDCMICGKPLGRNRMFMCEECSTKAMEESK